MIPSIFAGYVPANSEIWVIRDSFMTLAAQHIEFWKAQAQRDPHEALYMLHWYDVKAVISQSISSKAAEVITSSLVNMLNNRPKPPQVLVVLLGDIKFWCDENALKYSMDTILIGLIKEIRRILSLRQRDLPPKAVGPDPLIYVVKLHWKPDKAVDSVPMYPKRRRTFNRLLDTIMRPRGVKTISLNEITIKVDKNFFLNHGSLSELGHRQIWKSLSDAIKDYDNFGYQKLVDFEVKPQKGLIVSSNESDIGDTNLEEEYSTTWIPRAGKKTHEPKFFKKAKGRGKRSSQQYNN